MAQGWRFNKSHFTGSLGGVSGIIRPLSYRWFHDAPVRGPGVSPANLEVVRFSAFALEILSTSAR